LKDPWLIWFDSTVHSITFNFHFIDLHVACLLYPCYMFLHLSVLYTSILLSTRRLHYVWKLFTVFVTVNASFYSALVNGPMKDVSDNIYLHVFLVNITISMRVWNCFYSVPYLVISINSCSSSGNWNFFYSRSRGVCSSFYMVYWT
jgi:signal transduction histidine kinase